MAGGPIGGHGPNRVIEFARQPLPPADSTLSKPGCSFVSNAAAPQITNALIAGLGFFLASVVAPPSPAAPRPVYAAPQDADLSISGWVVGGTQANQGRVPPTIFASQDNPWQIQPQVWESLFAGKTPRVPPLTVGGIPQADPAQLAAKVWASQPAATAPPAAPLRSIWASPELHDLSISGWSIGGAVANQGPIPPLIFAQQSDPTQLAAKVWKSPPAPASVTPNPVAGFFSVPAQTPDEQTRIVWKSQPAAPTSGALASFIKASPEWIDLSISGWVIGGAQVAAITPNPIATFFAIPPQSEDRETRAVWKSLLGYAQPLSQEYRFGTHAKAIHEAEGLKSSIWKSQPAAPLVGRVPPQTAGAPQADPSPNPTRVWTPSTFTSPTVGVTVSPIFSVPPQVDLTFNSTQIFSPGLTPLIPIPPLPLILDSGVKHEKPITIRLREVEKREDLAAFLKAQIALRTPPVAPDPATVPITLPAAQPQDAAAIAEKERLLAEEKERKRVMDINNRIIAMILASYDDQ